MESIIIPRLNRIFRAIYNILKKYSCFDEKEYYRTINILNLKHNYIKLQYGKINFYIKLKNRNVAELEIYENDESMVKKFDPFSTKKNSKETIKIKKYIVTINSSELVNMYYKQRVVDRETNELRILQLYKMKKYPDSIERTLSFPEKRFIIDIVTYNDKDMGGLAQIINDSRFGSLYTSERIDNITEEISIFETEKLLLGDLADIDRPNEKIKAKIAYQYKVEFLGNYIEFKIDSSSENAVLNYQINQNVERIPLSIQKKIRDKIEVAKRSGFEIKRIN